MRAIATLLFIAIAAAAIAAEPPVDSAQKQELPLILLTGFEPFGPGKPANPSWEGIRQLDGQEWHGYRLAAREMKVEWGVPLPTLKRLIDELHPVAIFSFGQGGGFTIETLAQNKRGAYPDNACQLPTETSIAPDGPAEYRATIDAKALTREFQSRDRRVRLSTEAGDYLCEETLYSLEHLKAGGKTPLTVAFCHVPPLQAAAGPNQVTAATIESFVEDVLAAWEATLPPPTVGGATPIIARQAAVDPREKEVRELIDRYFKSWSNQDLVRYGQCFMPQAAIQLIDPDRGLITMPLAPFLQSQQQAHQASPNKMTETPESIKIRFDAELAHALVYWKLVDGQRLEFGYDHFTLMKSDGKWRIANIVFYAVKPPTDAKAK